MTDREISVGCVTAAALWTVTAGLLVVGVALDEAWLGRLALAFSAASATATIRCYFVRQNALLRAIARRESSGPSVYPVHPVR